MLNRMYASPPNPPSQVGLTKPPTKAVACNPRYLRAVIDSDILPCDAMWSTPHLPIEYRPDSYANPLLEGSSAPLGGSNSIRVLELVQHYFIERKEISLAHTLNIIHIWCKFNARCFKNINPNLKNHSYLSMNPMWLYIKLLDIRRSEI